MLMLMPNLGRTGALCRERAAASPCVGGSGRVLPAGVAAGAAAHSGGSVGVLYCYLN